MTDGIKLRVISHDPLDPSLLDFFKQHAGICDDSRDDVLLGYLEGAVLKVSRYIDRPLVGLAMRLEIQNVAKGERIRLYCLSDGTVTSVKDGAGNSIAYDRQGAYVRTSGREDLVVIDYKAERDGTAWCQYQNTVFELALARYQGKTPEELNAILVKSI